MIADDQANRERRFLSRAKIRAGRRDLLPKSRLYVHLSSDKETAKKVGSRHGKPVIYEIDCRQMAADGYRFFESANHVWLTKEVPVKYLKKEEIN